jgi:chromosomal replication initiator protein
MLGCAGSDAKGFETMTDRPQATETALRLAMTERLGADRCGLWFGEGVRLGIDGDALTVGAPNGFHRDWVRGRFSADLHAVGEALAGRPLQLAFEIAAEADPRVDREPATTAPAPSRSHPAPVGPPVEPIGPPATAEPGPAQAPRPAHTPRFKIDTPPVTPSGRPARRLDDFATGPGNRLAHAAAVEMAAALGATFNPLFLHGGVGLGKSHLLEGIVGAARLRAPGRKVVHVTAEGFTNAFLEALRTHGLSTFRSRHRSADLLIVDDVHFLASKRATLDEFLHTFDAVTRAGGAVVLAADQHPRQIPKLTDELATRFLGGMVVKLEAPDPATRRAILRGKALARGVDLPDAVVAFLADHLRGSVRELEGALHTLVAHATLTGRRLDLALAKSALRDTIRFTAQAVALRDIEKAICRVFNVEPGALLSDSRSKLVTHPRMLAMFLARKHAGASYSEIGRHFGGRNHSTVISAEKKVRSWLEAEQRQGLLAGFESVADALAAIEGELGV